jgi:hypothetical protein
MTEGFNNENPRVNVNKEELNKIIKQYKKLNKYRRSALFTVKTIDGTESVISSLVKEAEDNPL